MFPPLRLRSALSLGGLSPRELAVRTWRASDEHEIQTRAAAVSFYAMLAMVPFIGVVLTLAVQLLPDLTGWASKADRDRQARRSNSSSRPWRRRSRRRPRRRSRSRSPPSSSDPPVGLISIGLAITIWLASSLFVAVIDAMNRIYGVKDRRGFLKLRLIAIFMTIVQAAILVGSLLAIVGWRICPRPAPARRLRRRPRDGSPVRGGPGDGPAQLRPHVLRRPRRRPELGMDHAGEHRRQHPVPRRDAALSRLRPQLRQLRQDLRPARRGDGPPVLVLDLEPDPARGRAGEQDHRGSLAAGQELRPADRIPPRPPTSRR